MRSDKLDKYFAQKQFIFNQWFCKVLYITLNTMFIFNFNHWCGGVGF